MREMIPLVLVLLCAACTPGPPPEATPTAAVASISDSAVTIRVNPNIPLSFNNSLEVINCGNAYGDACFRAAEKEAGQKCSIYSKKAVYISTSYIRVSEYARHPEYIFACQ